MSKDYDAVHSFILPGDPTYLESAQYQIFTTIGFCFAKNLKDVLLLGLGGGEFLSYLNNYFLNTHVDALDINPAMFEIIEKFRKINSNLNQFICDDAFKYVFKMKDSYDLIYCDVYSDKPFPSETYKGFFEKAREHLNEGGVFVWNAFIQEISRTIVERMFESFENIMAIATDDGSNIVFICYQGTKKSKENLEEAANNMQAQYNFRYALPDLMKKAVPISREDKAAWVMKFPVLG
ncbi:MAG: class I SAM-dependent methyltransferase [Alphaproteobacteria bacterium]|nr:class I SAM-dependent methyltransferase [Alphaproteobacteria bacterium]